VGGIMDSHVVLPDSRRARKADARLHGPVDPDSRLEVTGKLAGPDAPEPTAGQVMSREEYESRYGASPTAVAAVTSELAGHGLVIEETIPATRSLRVSGTAAQIEDAFRPGLGIYFSPSQGLFRGREGDLEVPSALAGMITGVFGLDQRRVAHRKELASRPARPRPLTADR